MHWRRGLFTLTVSAFLFSGCAGIQSALDPAGREAERIANLFWWMAGGAVVIWLGVIGLAIYSMSRAQSHSVRAARFYIIGGGAALPVVVLAALLAYGLSMVPELVATAPPGSLKIVVSGEQWWWRVVYESPGGSISLANEIHLIAGQPVQFELVSPDVIHSFWIPSIGGKVDMIPGRRNRLALHPTKPGVYRGACAEYCGASHALMNFYVVVQEKPEFAQWLERQAQPAQPPMDAFALRGREAFLSNGCGACHTIRGTPATGVVGPDLTHVGSRVSLAAGILRNEPDAFLRWIRQVKEIKPGARMPEFAMLPQDDLRAIAAYLNGLQ
jgi:cytochrome c oxidase subunit 2